MAGDEETQEWPPAEKPGIESLIRAALALTDHWQPGKPIPASLVADLLVATAKAEVEWERIKEKQ